MELSFGVFFKSIESEFNLSRTITSSFVSISMILLGVFAFLGGWANDKYGPRTVFLLMGLFTGLSLLLTSQTTSPWQLYISYSLLFSLGTSAMYVVLSSTVFIYLTSPFNSSRSAKEPTCRSTGYIFRKNCEQANEAAGDRLQINTHLTDARARLILIGRARKPLSGRRRCDSLMLFARVASFRPCSSVVSDRALGSHQSVRMYLTTKGPNGTKGSTRTGNRRCLIEHR